jgi:6-phosphogluconolactonase (cycloisomerase 2 family)
MSCRRGGKLVLFFAITLIVISILAGCAGVSNANPATPGTPGNPGSTPPGGQSGSPASVSQVLYMSSSDCSGGTHACDGVESSDGVHAFRIDSTTGQLTDLANSPFFTGRIAGSIALHPSGKLMFVGEFSEQSGAQDIVALAIDPHTGALTKLHTSNVESGDIVMDPSGKFLYSSGSDPSTGRGSLASYAINAGTGELTLVQTVVTPALVLAVDPRGRFLYGQDSTFTYGFSINSDGTLTPMPGSPFLVPGRHMGQEIFIHPDGKFLYLNGFTFDNGGHWGILGFSINSTTGALTPLPGSPFLDSPELIQVRTFNRAGTLAYANNVSPANSGIQFLVSLGVDGNSGAITRSQAVQADALSFSPLAITDLTDQFLYVSTATTPRLDGFKVNAAGGISPFSVAIQGKPSNTSMHAMAVARLQ